MLRLDTRDGEHITCEHVSPVKCPEWALRDLMKGPFMLEHSRAFNQRRVEEHVSGLISHLVLTEELEKQVDRSEPDSDLRIPCQEAQLEESNICSLYSPYFAMRNQDKALIESELETGPHRVIVPAEGRWRQIDPRWQTIHYYQQRYDRLSSLGLQKGNA
ncbi:hypothetical protein DPX16_4719 [Anabarilius grahami]|uniref:Uncharacterized protein n=1 Tax=Anabarilius grahami TaxID=495550 RepID=A0A3N0YHW6_ANAGA|nr:hypothetical protein DPX16_4719 [Anabarilius grahami]